MPIHEQNIYFPLEKGQYQVSPGLHAFGTDFGNSNADRLIFQFDGDFDHYRKTKLAARTEALEKYYCKTRLFIFSQGFKGYCLIISLSSVVNGATGV